MQALEGDEALGALLGDGESVYQRNSFDHEAPPDNPPWIIYAMGVEGQSGISALRAYTSPVELWVHDVKGDYDRIDRIIDRARIVLEAVSSGEGLTEIRYTGRSHDLEDLDMDTILRFGTFQATYKPEEEA